MSDDLLTLREREARLVRGYHACRARSARARWFLHEIVSVRLRIKRLEEADMQEMLDVQRIYLPGTESDFKAAGRRRPGAEANRFGCLLTAPGGFLRGGAVEARQGHVLKAAGSIPAPASKVWRVARWVLLAMGWSMVAFSVIGVIYVASGGVL